MSRDVYILQIEHLPVLGIQKKSLAARFTISKSKADHWHHYV
jgi:hypothetical protein